MRLAWPRFFSKPSRLCSAFPVICRHRNRWLESNLVAFVPQRLAASLAQALSLTLSRPPTDRGRYSAIPLLSTPCCAGLSIHLAAKKSTREMGEQHQHGAAAYGHRKSRKAFSQPRIHSLLERKA